MKFTTLFFAATALLIATATGLPTPQFGGSIDDHPRLHEPFYKPTVAQQDTMDPLHDALYPPSGPAKPVVATGGEKRQFGGSVHEGAFEEGASSSDKRQFGGGLSADSEVGGSDGGKRGFGGSREKR